MPPKNTEKLLKQFDDLTKKTPEDQCDLFLRSFIFALDDWKEVVTLLQTFRKYIREAQQSETDLNVIQASDFLQKNGKTRSAIQRKEELRDIDLNHDNRICLIEYLLLHFKMMILREYYKRTGETPEEDMTKLAGIGITGVGPKLLDELFDFPAGLPAELQKALDEFAAVQRERQAKIDELSKKAAAGGVKGMAAKNELAQLDTQDMTEMNRLELTLNAAKKKAMKEGGGGGDETLKQKKAEEEAAKKAKAEASKARLAAMASRFEGK